MKFSNKKFNIKKFVKVSAVALAMISAGGIASTINANTNVHADVVSSDIAIANKVNKGQSAQIKRDETHAEIAGDRSDPNALAEDIAYNKSFVKKHKSQLMSGLSNKTKSAVKKQVKADKGSAKPKTSNKVSDSHVKMPSIFNVSTHNNKESASVAPTTSSNQTATPSKSKSKRTHLSKATIRKIMNSRKILKRMKADKRAIRKDKKYLSTRSAKRFMRNYTKRSKSLKRTKRIQKRAMAVKGAKRYVRYYKDEVKHEKDLVRLIKSNRVSKVTKRHARRSLKRVRKNLRKNRKNVKRAHKVTRHHNSKNRK